MSIIVTGKTAWQDFGLGTWTLVSENGETYELKDPPPQLCQSQSQVQVTGQIREDMMTLAALGPVLEVISFEVIEG